MSVNMKMQDSKTRYSMFVCDTESDIKLLPTSKSTGKDNLSTVYDCAMGSIAEIISDNTIYYLLDGNDVWVKKTKSGGGGGGGGDYEWADEQDIDNLFP